MDMPEQPEQPSPFYLEQGYDEDGNWDAAWKLDLSAVQLPPFDPSGPSPYCESSGKPDGLTLTGTVTGYLTKGLLDTRPPEDDSGPVVDEAD